LSLCCLACRSIAPGLGSAETFKKHITSILLCLYFSAHLPGSALILFCSNLPCCARILQHAFLSAVALIYFALNYPAVPLSCFVLTLLCNDIILLFAYPAVRLSCSSLTLLCDYFSAHLPCCMRPYFSLRLPCLALKFFFILFFFRTYFAAHLFILLAPIKATMGSSYSS